MDVADVFGVLSVKTGLLAIVWGAYRLRKGKPRSLDVASVDASVWGLLASLQAWPRLFFVCALLVGAFFIVVGVGTVLLA